MLPVLAAIARCRKQALGRRWSLDETYIKVSGEWKYLHRALDKCGNTVNLPFTAKRDKTASRRFLERAIGLHDAPEKITIDKSGANTAAIESVKADAFAHIALRQSQYLNNMVEQDHRFIKRITRPMLGFKSFWCARIIISDIESYNRTVRNDWLAHYFFESVDQVQEFATKWFWTYNHERPNTELGVITPPTQKLALRV